MRRAGSRCSALKPDANTRSNQRRELKLDKNILIKTWKKKFKIENIKIALNYFLQNTKCLGIHATTHTDWKSHESYKRLSSSSSNTGRGVRRNCTFRQHFISEITKTKDEKSMWKILLFLHEADVPHLTCSHPHVMSHVIAMNVS